MSTITFNKESKSFQLALLDLLHLYTRGFTKSSMYREVYEYGPISEATVYISPDIEKTNNELCKNTPIVKRVSTYRDNHESDIVVNDLISSYNIYCMIDVYPFKKEGCVAVDRIEIQPPLLEKYFKDEVMYYFKNIDDFIPGDYEVVVRTEENEYIDRLVLSIVSEPGMKVGYLNEIVGDDK